MELQCFPHLSNSSKGSVPGESEDFSGNLNDIATIACDCFAIMHAPYERSVRMVKSREEVAADPFAYGIVSLGRADCHRRDCRAR